MPVQAILHQMREEFKKTRSPSASFRKYSGPEYEKFWKKDVNLYRECVRRLIQVDQIGAAFDLIGKGLADHPDDPVLEYRRILALARVGNTSQALQSIEELKLRDRLFPAQLEGRKTAGPKDRSGEDSQRHTQA